MKTLSWKALEGPVGTRVTVSDDYTAVASDHRMGIWKADELLGTWENPAGRPGWPVIAAGHLHWASWIIPLEDVGQARQIAVLGESVRSQLEVDMTPTPQGAFQIEGMQWNREGTRLLVAIGWRGAGQADTRVFELDQTGQWQGVLWQGREKAPRAYWGGNDEWILGFAQPILTSGNAPAIPGQVAPLRLRVSADGKSLLIVRPQQLEVWDLDHQTARWQVPGTWLDADLGPDGSFIVAASMNHELFWLDGQNGSQQVLDAPAPVAAVGVGSAHIAASFASGWQVGRAQLP